MRRRAAPANQWRAAGGRREAALPRPAPRCAPPPSRSLPPLQAPGTAARRRSRRPAPAGAAPAEGRREEEVEGGEAKTGAAHVMGRRSQ